MNQSANALKAQEELLHEWANIDENQFDIDELEEQLEYSIEEQIEELHGLELDHEKIGTPNAIGDVIKDVIHQQIVNQFGVEAGEEFIEKNNGLKLDLRDDAHIQTPENFQKGKLASHNYKSIEQLEQNYDRYNNTPHKQFRKEYINPGMNESLKRAGQLYKEGVEYVKDIYSGRQIPTQTKLEDGSNNPKAAQREHVKSSEKLFENPSLQMANTDQELAKTINDPENLQGYTTAERNLRKSNHSPEEMQQRDKNKHWEEANKRAEEFIKKKEKEGEKRLKKEGRQTQIEEAFRISREALKAAIRALLYALIVEIIKKLVVWFKSGEKKLQTFLNSLKDAFQSFISDLTKYLRDATDAVLTAIATAIIGPIVGLIKKAWIFLKQGYKSLKQAIDFLKNPNNKNKPFSDKMVAVGKIVIVGLTAGSAIALGEVITIGLKTIPPLAIEIPLFGSIAVILGIFLGGLVSAIIGALALNLIDRMVAKKQKAINEGLQIEKRNDILTTQQELQNIKEAKVYSTRDSSLNRINERHQHAYQSISASLEQIHRNSIEINAPIAEKAETTEDDHETNSGNEEALNNLFRDLNNLNN